MRGTRIADEARPDLLPSSAAGLRPLLALVALLATLVACGERESQAPPEPPAESILQAQGSDFSEPDLAASPDGELALVFLAFDGVHDRVMASLHRVGVGASRSRVSAEGGTHLTPRVTADPSGGFLVVWSARTAPRPTSSRPGW